MDVTHKAMSLIMLEVSGDFVSEDLFITICSVRIDVSFILVIYVT